MYLNILVALSNIFGIPALLSATGHYKHLLLCVMFASTLMHLSETKHNLPGIYPFNKYSYIFLQLDRLVAYVCCVVYIRLIYTSITPNIFACSIGLIFMAISELFTTTPYSFSLFHILWHASAYYIIYDAIIQL